jgi:hypothetical protein
MQVFHPSTNAISRFSIFGAVFFVAFVLWVLYMLNRSPYATRQNVAQAQPVPFSHQHHVAGLGIDCRYCHTTVETSSFAGIPPTSTCMNCHSQIWTNAAMLEPVRASFRSGEPIRWTRVHDLPDFVQFNHSIHVQKGIGCVSCHGRVDQMPLTWQAQPLTMSWCLECHRAPERFIRPRDKVFDLAWEPRDQLAIGRELVKQYHVQQKVYCSACHY